MMRRVRRDIWRSVLAGALVCGSLSVPARVEAAEEAGASSSGTLLTLAESYQLALRRSEEIAIRKELLVEAQAHFLQALSDVLPHVSFDLSERRQDGSGTSAFTLRRVPERKFALTQPLFSGFKAFAALSGSRAERKQREYEQRRAEQVLLVDVADAFYLLRQEREDLATLEAIRAALSQRIDELNERERLGRSRPSEAVSAEAQLRRVEAEMADVAREELLARQLLEFLTGRDQIEGTLDSPEVALQPAADDVYLAKVGSRPDVQAQAEAWQVAKRAVWVAQAKFWPTANLEANYYTERVGVSADVDWDALVTVEIPLFQGGEALGDTKLARSRARQAKLHFEQAQRAAELDIRDAVTQWRSELFRLDALDQALQAAETNYQLQTADYRLNLVNNLEVLQALQALEDARRDVIRSRYEARRLAWRLRTATGDGWR